jgi:hypothetical protein
MDCPACFGHGMISRKCACFKLPDIEHPFNQCPKCNEYRIRGCHECGNTGEVTAYGYRQMTMLPDELEEYENRKNPA